jgi:4-amino-4-deoxy-L-arabinose transferase
MIFYQTETIYGLAIVSLPAVVGTLLFFFTERKKLAFAMVILSAFLLRLLMISLDPFLHDWDEKFHALVAKNMIENPLKPVLIAERPWGEDMLHWCCSHVWLHKQPLFLWQMALSLKVFGFNEIALRLPSAILGTIGVYFIREIADFWTKNKEIAFVSALLMCFSYYHLELTAGYLTTDHNDITFFFYVTASFWAFIRYLKNDYSWSWAVWIGVFAGCAILVKWLTGLLIFGTWGLYILLQKEERFASQQYLKLGLGICSAIIVFLPWQLYISYAFPVESAREYALNTEHVFKVVEGHAGDLFYHLLQQKELYTYLTYLILPSIILLFLDKRISKSLSIALLAAVLVVFGFFSLIVATKMPAFTLPVSSLLIVIIALGIVKPLDKLKKIFPANLQAALFVLVILFVIPQIFQPSKIAEKRSILKTSRNIDIHNTLIYKDLNQDILTDRVLFNTKCEDAIDIMFYKDATAICYYPKEAELDSLQALGRKLVRFKNIYNLDLPNYLTQDSSIMILDHDVMIPENK